MSPSTCRSFCALALTTVTANVGLWTPAGGHDEDGHDEDRSAPTADVIVFNDNGAWSWFEDERAVVDVTRGMLLVSSVASAGGTGGVARHGNVEVVAYDLASGSTRRSVLHRNLQADDHDSAALYVRPDGRTVAMYSMHATDRLTRWRVTRQTGNPTSWEPERTFDHGAPTTYSNVYTATEADDLYAFVRAVGRDPHILVSHDHGSTWGRGGRLLDGPGRPYVRYAATGSGGIHLIATEQHPDDYANGIYHGVVADGQLLRSDGTAVDTNLFDASAAPPESLTEVFSSDATRRAWTVDLQVDRDGHPYAAFSVHSGASRNRYFYARFDGTDWHVHFMAHAGSELYRDQPHYTGLIALDPHDPNRAFISTDVDPVTGMPLISNSDQRRHHELFEGVTVDGGASWSWRALTSNSTVDNIRPIVPLWDPDHTALLWLRGTYTSYHDYDLDVVGIVVAGSARSTMSGCNLNSDVGTSGSGGGFRMVNRNAVGDR